jgi:hypothetical protein
MTILMMRISSGHGGLIDYEDEDLTWVFAARFAAAH